MSSVTFDSTEIVNSTYLPRYIKHESAPLRDLALVELTNQNGSVLVSEKYGVKYITVIGKLIASSRSNLDTAIDTFKELFSRKEKNLDIEWGGSTRRYVATCVRHDFDRDFYHNLFIPWSAEFVVSSGIGEDTSETTLISNDDFDASVGWSGTMTFLGSAKPMPRIRVKLGGTATTCNGIELKNTDTGERIIMTRLLGFASGKYVQFDCKNKIVTYDGDEVSFYGVFPTFDIGSNNVTIKYGRITNQQFYKSSFTNASVIYGDIRVAQSFSVSDTDTTFKTLQIYSSKIGSPPSVLKVQIETDNGGSPSGTPVSADAYAIFSIATSGWQLSALNDYVTLEANTKYWLVCKTANDDGDSSNYYEIGYKSGIEADYKRGNRALTTDAGVSWEQYADNDLGFILSFGGTLTAETGYLDVYYYKRWL